MDDEAFGFLCRWVMTFGTDVVSHAKRFKWYHDEERKISTMTADSANVHDFFKRNFANNARQINKKGLNYIKNNGGKNG